MRKQVEQLEPQEAEGIFRIETSWERRGRILGRQEGLKEGLDIGTRKGQMEAQREVARRLLAQGTAMSVADIARLTDLEPEEVERLQAQQNS